MNLNDFKRLIRPLQNKIFLLLGRAILKAIDNSEGTQKIQVIALSGETITGMERFQEYGFETYPFTEAEVAAIFLNGNRSHGIALCVHDRRYRPKDLVEGEVAVYTDEDVTTPFRMQMKRNRIHFRRSDKEDIDIDTSKTEDIGTSKTEIIGTSKTVTVPTEININTTEHVINSPQISLGGANFAALKAIMTEDMIAIFNNHVHSQGNDSNGDVQANTDVPTTTLVVGTHATSKIKGA